jgi:hypothetical protein
MRLVEVNYAFSLSVGECQLVLHTKQRWSGFYQDEMKLLSLFEQAMDENEKTAPFKAQKRM